MTNKIFLQDPTALERLTNERKMHMYTRPKLTDSVSVEELLTMRECGLGNAEIAKRLDTSPATIYKYIGKQPKALNKPCGKAAASYKQSKLADPTPVSQAMSVTLDEPENLDIFGVDDLPEKKACPMVFTCDADKVQPWEGGLKVISRITHAESERARYTIDTQNGTVKVGHKQLSSNEIYDEASLQKYIAELTEVLTMLKK